MSTPHDDHHGSYYVPEYSWWPILAAVGLFFLGLGSVEYFSEDANGARYLFGGTAILLLVLISWFTAVIRENRKGLYDNQMHRTFWWGMLWFLFSDFMLFFGLLGALWYYRLFTLPELAGFSPRMLTHFLLWPEFVTSWPLLVNPDAGQFTGPQQGLILNWKAIVTTLVLLVSGLTLYLANLGVLKNRRGLASSGLIVTFLLAVLFLVLNSDALYLAITRFGLTMSSGIYGSTVILMMAIYLLHVLIASFMLLLLFVRNFYGHFSSNRDFSIRALNWYWAFLIFVWLMIFFSVY